MLESIGNWATQFIPLPPPERETTPEMNPPLSETLSSPYDNAETGNPQTNSTQSTASSEVTTGAAEWTQNQIAEPINQLNSDGDQAVFSITAEGKVQVGIRGLVGVMLKGREGYATTVQQVGGAHPNGQPGDTEPDYEVTFAKNLLLGTGVELPAPRVDPEFELHLRSQDSVTMRFESKDEAIRAVELLGQLSAAEGVHDALAPLQNPLGATTSALTDNPAGNPLRESTASGESLDELTHPFGPSPGDRAANKIGPSDTEMQFLRDNITSYSSMVGARERAMIQGKLPLFLGLGVNGAAFQDGIQNIVRTVKPAQDGESGSVTYTFVGKTEGYVGGGLSVGAGDGDAFWAGVSDSFFKKFNGAQFSVSLTWHTGQAELNPTASGGPGRLEADVPAAVLNSGAPDQASLELQAAVPYQGLSLDLTRTDLKRFTANVTVDEPTREQLGTSLNQLLHGELNGAVDSLIADPDDSIVLRQETIERSGYFQIPSADVALADLNEAGLSLLLSNGVDNVVDRREVRYEGETANQPDNPDPDCLDNTPPVETNVEPDVSPLPQTGRTNSALEQQGYTDYVVQPGDTIWDIAERYGVDFQATVALNSGHLADPDLIYPGDTIYLPIREPATDNQRPPGTDCDPPSDNPNNDSSGSDNSTGSSPTGSDSTGSDTTGSSPTGSSPFPFPFPPADGVPFGTNPTDSEPVNESEGSDISGDESPSDRPNLDRVLEEYQVKEDEMVTFEPDIPGVPGFLEDPLPLPSQEVTQTEAELLDSLSPFELKDFKEIKDQAYETPFEYFPETSDDPRVQQDGHYDAFKHAYWAATLANRFGQDFAHSFVTAHEGLPNNEALREAMDLYNDEVGLRIASEHPDASNEELAQLVYDAVMNGETVVVDSNGDLAWSDQVAFGEHGNAANTSTLPGIIDPDSETSSTASGP